MAEDDDPIWLRAVLTAVWVVTAALALWVVVTTFA